MTSAPPHTASAPACAGRLPALPHTGVLEKRSELLGIWQRREVRIDVGSLTYYKDGALEARAAFSSGDVLGASPEPPSTVLLRVRRPGGEERTYAFRATSAEDMELWVALIRRAFDLDPAAAAAVEPTRPAMTQRSSTDGRGFVRLASYGGDLVRSTASMGANLVGEIAKASGQEERLNRSVEFAKDRVDAARRSTARWREQLEHQMEEALASCDEGKTEMLLDSALAAGLLGERAPGVLRRAARRAAARGLRDAAQAGDPKRLKGALVAARRLGATDVPEFEPAVTRYREVRRLPEGWDVARMVAERRHGRARLLTRSDVSSNLGLKALVQLLFDRTYRSVDTRDRRGEAMPQRLEVVQVVEVANEDMWVDYLVRREAIREELRASAGSGRALPADFRMADAATEGALSEAQALASSPKEVPIPAGATPGTAIAAESPVTGQALTVFVPEGDGAAAAPMRCMIEERLPGPPTETTANEVWLFHGTRPVAAAGITMEHFKIDLAGSHAGALYGRGIYVAENCTKADEYSRQDPPTGLYTMLLCRVTLGRLHYTAEVSPDARVCEDACLRGDCHAVLGDRKACRGTFREFCVFDEDQVYPNFIVHYKRVL